VFGDQPGCRTRKDHAAIATLGHAAHYPSRELKGPVQVDAHGLLPGIRALLPDELFVSRADAVVADKYLDRSKARFRLRNGLRAAFCCSDVGDKVFEAQGLQLCTASGDAHDARTARCQEFCCCTSDSTTCTCH